MHTRHGAFARFGGAGAVGWDHEVEDEGADVVAQGVELDVSVCREQSVWCA